ncbi:MAG: MBL fold metallo-hydrolase [Verrucomicrobiota bacterium]
MSSSEIWAKIWGCRGSIPTPLYASQVRDKIERALWLARGRDLSSDLAISRFIESLPFEVSGTYGGNTSCVELSTEGTDEYLLLDAGSGLKSFSEEFMKRPESRNPATFHFVMSHLHWDHIQGFPFFGPAYIPGNTIIIYGYHSDIERLFNAQMNDAWFPVNYDSFRANIEFRPMEPESPFEICGYRARGVWQNHPGVAFGYRFERNGKAIIYSTDSEHDLEKVNDAYHFIDFFRDADLLIFDAQYTLEDNIVSKQNWGHSNNVIAVEMAMRSNVKHLLIFHHDPANSDENLSDFLNLTLEYREVVERRFQSSGVDAPNLKIGLAHDGLVIPVL